VLLHRWDGMTLEEASTAGRCRVGSHLFVQGHLGNVRRGLQYAQQSTAKESVFAQVDLRPKAIADGGGPDVRHHTAVLQE
jgi:hypothetical protein